MKKNLLLNVFCLFCLTNFAQQVEWAFNVSENPASNKLTVDPASNLYLYGCTESYRPGPQDGSIFKKYSPSGELLVDKAWHEKVFISSMIHDGAGSFYFCGYFRGQVNSDGISLNSKGGTDGFFGKMSDEGEVEWTIGFGGAKNDVARDLTFNQDSTEIVITGDVDSTVYLYGYEIVTTTAAIFVAKFSLEGGLSSYRTFVFSPGEYGYNQGWEIEKDGLGGYYLLANRKGEHWNNYPPSGETLEGRYIFKLSENLEIKWSEYIISSACYYGFSCANISVQKGEVCVPSFCSAKYGGTGKLRKLEPLNGTGTWNIDNADGTYYDTYAAGARLLYVGNEEGNGCPCEDHNVGYARVKMLDELNTDRILLSKYGFAFLNVVQAPNGNIYVYGRAGSEDPHLQGHYLERGHFLFSMQEPPSSVELAMPTEELLSVYPNPSSGYLEITHDKTIEELVVTTANGTVVRQFSPRGNAATVRDLAQGYYIVHVKDAQGYSRGKVLVAE